MPDRRVAVFAGGIGFFSAMLFGLTAALQVSAKRHRATIAQRSPPLIGQLLVESLLLSVTGAAAFAWGSSHSGTVKQAVPR
jgi:hypothetical protein